MTPTAPIIIAGMHRSGTTLVSQLLQGAGLHIGGDLEKNAESRFFLNINRWLLQQSGGRWDQPEPVSAVLDDPALSDLFTQSITTLMASKRSHAYLGKQRMSRGDRLPTLTGAWGWKDPRNTWTLPLWLALFPDAKVIHVTRHGVDVASSLHTRNQSIVKRHLPLEPKDVINFIGRKKRITKVRDGLSPACATLEGAFNLWRSYLAAGKRHLAQADQVHEVCYETLLTEPGAVMPGLVSFCGLNEPAAPDTSDTINASRCYAYRKDEALLAFAQQHQADLQAFGYDA